MKLLKVIKKYIKNLRKSFLGFFISYFYKWKINLYLIKLKKILINKINLNAKKVFKKIY